MIKGKEKCKDPTELFDGHKYSFYVDDKPYIGIYKVVRNAFFNADTGNKICGSHQAVDIKLKSEPNAPLKPLTKAEYVRVDKSGDNGAFWECARDFSEVLSGVFHYMRDFELFAVNDIDELLRHYKANNLYRKVETEITWQGEVEEFISKSNTLTVTDFSDFIFEGADDTVVKEFIEMCHLVSSMNK